MFSAYLLFAASFGIALVMFLMVFVGVRGGKLGHTSGLPPYVFKKQPLRFVILVIFYAGLGVFFPYNAIVIGSEIWKRM